MKAIKMRKFFILLLILVFVPDVNANDCSHPKNTICLCKLIKKASDIAGIQCKLLAILPTMYGESQSHPSIQALNLQQSALQNELNHEFNQLLFDQQVPPLNQILELSMLIILQIQFQILIVNNWNK